MIKYLILFLLLTTELLGQNKLPISFANNSYSICKENSIFNTNVYLDATNKIQICAFGGGICWQNNEFETVEKKDSIIDKKWSKIFNETHSKKQWVVSKNRIDIYENDSLLKTKRIAFDDFSNTYFKNNTLYYVNFSDSSISKFDGNKTQILNQFDEKVYNYQVFYDDFENKIYFVVFFKNKFSVYKESVDHFVLQKEIKAKYEYHLEIIYLKNGNCFYFTKPTNSDLLDLMESNGNSIKNIGKIPFKSRFFKNYLILKNDYGIYNLSKIENSKIVKISNLTYQEGVRNFVFDTITNSIFVGTDNKPVRSFLHLNNYPKLFHNLNSSSIFAVSEDHLGRIFAGSYQGAMTIIEKENKTEFDLKKYFPINAGLKIKDKIYFSDLNSFIEIDKDLKIKTSLENHQSYVAHLSKDKKTVYLGLTRKKGLFKTDATLLYNHIPNWEKVDSTKGFNFEKIYTISEDKLNRIWCGSPGEGIGIYDPKENNATFVNSKNIHNFGPISSALDSRGGLWFGGYNSNLFYIDANEKQVDFNKFISIKHPLLESKNRIMSLAVFENYLVIGAYDKILLLDINEYYTSKKIKIRYLNPNETNFTSFVEQNTMIVAQDKTIWFSTSDNLYQWDIKKWLSLPTFKVIPSVLIKKDSTEINFASNKYINFRPNENSFQIQINYQTKDNMPRYINGILSKKGVKPNFESPDLKTKFQYTNLSPGAYIFYIRVCQQDGSYDIYEYPIGIEKYLWQKWWFWFVLTISFIGLLIYFFQRRNEIEKQKKKMSQLNLSSLSNQFRPHFMLNVLNNIGSQMQDKPHAEKVISRLGESINILYRFTQENEFTIPFSQEWKLVENSVEIQKLLFIPHLNWVVQNNHIIPNDYKIPIGLLQIPVENALLHGLRNKTDGSCVLEIDFNENNTHYFINITDNGIGREKAGKINNFKKNGNGLKTILKMISTINRYQKNAVNFEIFDNTESSGTIVKIALCKKTDYDKIKK